MTDVESILCNRANVGKNKLKFILKTKLTINR